MDLEVWRAQRAAYWRRFNRVLNVAMLIAVGFLLWRYFKG
jgi:hypothetical protein